MKTTQVEMQVRETRATMYHTAEAIAVVRNREPIIGEQGPGIIEGELTFHNFKLQPGQRIKAEFHILNPDV